MESNIGKAKVEAFGSHVTKLYLPKADIDIVLESAYISSYGLLSRAAKLILNKKEEYKNVNIIKNAKVPLIKCKDCINNVDLDISFNKPDGVT